MRRITLRDCIVATAAYFEVPAKSIPGKMRHRKYSLPRHVCMHVARCVTGLTYSQIASRLGGLDHSTVVYGNEAIAALKQTDPKVREAVVTICDAVSSDEFRERMNAAAAISLVCRALDPQKRTKDSRQETEESPMPHGLPIFVIPQKEPVLVWRRTRHDSLPSEIAPPPKERLMGARA